ncbi:MAG: hypothetical protein K8F32_01035 [Rhodocyclaceae bacterium]|nr:hypothetical protein [Rhodocyclaceae bacterium]
MSIEEAKERNGKLKEYGLYQIHAVKPSGKPIPIPRMRMSDRDGILYIGRSGLKRKSPVRTLANRIREFENKQHSGGITYADAASRLKGVPRYAGHQLEVRAMFLPDAMIVQEEARIIKNYFRKYAELPPCNSSAGSRVSSQKQGAA